MLHRRNAECLSNHQPVPVKEPDDIGADAEFRSQIFEDMVSLSQQPRCADDVVN